MEKFRIQGSLRRMIVTLLLLLAAHLIGISAASDPTPVSPRSHCCPNICPYDFPKYRKKGVDPVNDEKKGGKSGS